MPISAAPIDPVGCNDVMALQCRVELDSYKRVVYITCTSKPTPTLRLLLATLFSAALFAAAFVGGERNPGRDVLEVAAEGGERNPGRDVLELAALGGERNPGRDVLELAALGGERNPGRDVLEVA